MRFVGLLAVTIALSGMYFVFLKRSVDVFSIAYAGTAFFFSPALLPTVSGIGSVDGFPVSNTTRFLGVLILLGIVLGDLALPRPIISFRVEDRLDRRRVQITHLHLLFVVTTVFGVLFFASAGLDAIGAAKILISKPPYVTALFRMSISLFVVAAALARHRIYLGVAFLFLFGMLIVFQIRSGVVYPLAGITLLYIRRQGFSIAERVKFGAGAGVAGFAFIFFDQAKGQLLAGNYNALLNPQPYRDVYLNNNAHKFIHIFELTIQNGFRINHTAEYLAAVLISAVPFSSTLIGVDPPIYGEYIIAEFLPWRSAGIASNFWAEFFALGGVVGLLVAIIFYLCGVAVLSANLDSPSPPVQIMAYTLAGYWGVHLHVLTLSQLFSTYITILSAVLVGTYTLACILTFLRFGAIQTKKGIKLHSSGD